MGKLRVELHLEDLRCQLQYRGLDGADLLDTVAKGTFYHFGVVRAALMPCLEPLVVVIVCLVV